LLLAPPEARALAHGTRLPAAAHFAPFLVLRALLEAALRNVAIDLGATNLPAAAYQVDRRFLPALERANDFVDHAIVDQWLQGGGCFHRSCWANCGNGAQGASGGQTRARSYRGAGRIPPADDTERNRSPRASLWRYGSSIQESRINANALFLLVPRGRGPQSHAKILPQSGARRRETCLRGIHAGGALSRAGW